MDVRSYYVYWIVSGRSSYIGATVDPVKRLKQHCGMLQGGAKRTRGKLWTYKCVITGFQTWNQALMYEWSFKYHSKRCRSIESRKNALIELMSKERWTSNSPLASEVPLTIEYDPIQYGMPPTELPVKNTNYNVYKRQKRRGFKQNLHGVTY